MIKEKLWFYISLMPLAYAIIGFILAYVSLVYQWGGNVNIATVISVFFCETVMVFSIFGALTYMKQPEKTPAVKTIFRLNLLLALAGFLLGGYLFMSGSI